jgi:hypothetical protein
VYIRSVVESLAFIGTIVGWRLKSGGGSIVEKKEEAAWGRSLQTTSK